MNKLKQKLKVWLGIEDNQFRIETIEDLIYHEESKQQGFAVLKPNILGETVRYAGKDIKPDWKNN